MSQGWSDLSYILIPILLLSLKNWLSYTARHIVYALLFAVEIPPNHVFIMRVYTILLYCTWSVSQRCKKTRVTSLRRPFSRRNICPKFKMTGVSERVRPQLYFNTNFVTVSQKLAELYSSAYFDALLFAVEIPPNHVFIMRVYTILLYCTWSVSQRYKKTRVASLRRPFSRRNICPKFLMTGVAERGRPQLYFDTNFVTVSQKLAELYSSAYCLCFTFCRSNPSQPCIHNACVYNHIVLYLLNVTALQKDEGYFPSATIF